MFNTITTKSIQVDAELMLRKSKSNRLRFKSQTPFVNAISGLTKNGKYISLSMYKLNNVNQDSTEIGLPYKMDIFRPKPSLISVSSEYKNKFGSVRKMNISWYCPNLLTLEELSPHFMTLGNTVYLEWGWTEASANSFYNIKNKEKYTINRIKERIKEINSPLFDASIGIITNYSFSLNDDESFTCTTELTSVASVMESIMTSGNVISPEIINNPNQPSFVSFKTYLNSGAFYNEIYLYSEIIKQNPEIYYKENPDHRILFVSTEQMLMMVGAYNGNTTKSFKFEFDSTKNPLYISWGFIEDIILGNNYNIYIQEGNTRYDISRIHSGGNLVKHYNYIRSSDLGVCIYPVINTGKIKAQNGQDDITYLRYPDESFNLQNYNFMGEIRKILIHTEFFRKTMSQNKNIMDGIKAILAEVSEVCGGYFEFILTEKENSQWQVVCLNQLNSEYDENAVYNFDIKNGETNIINSSIKTSLSNIAALNVFYNAQRDDGIIHGGDLDGNIYSFFDYNNKDYIDEYGFQNNISTDNAYISDNSNDTIAQLKQVMQISKKSIIDKHNKFGYKYLKRYLPVSDYGYNFIVTSEKEDIKFNIDGDEGMKYAIASNMWSTHKINDVLSSIVPIDITIELDGISGFNIADAFKCNFIHSAFAGKGLFQIVGITDNIERSHWKTQLKVNFRAMNKINNNIYKCIDSGDANTFWKSVKVDKTLIPKFENIKTSVERKSATPAYHIYYSTEGWALPVPKNYDGLESFYNDSFTGYSKYSYPSTEHRAIDISNGSANDVPIISCLSGTVIRSSISDRTYLPQNSSHTPTNSSHGGGNGNYVYIQTGDIILKYLHMRQLNEELMEIGTKISKGDRIGWMGNTGHSTGRHLHLHCNHVNGTILNPMAYLYSALGNENIQGRGFPFNTAYSIIGDNFSKGISINDIQDYVGLRDAFITNPGTTTSILPNTKNLLIVIGGWSSSDGATQKWANALQGTLGSSYGIISKDYPAIYPSNYSGDPLNMKVIANELNNNFNKYDDIYIVGHSSGAFAAYYLINNLTKTNNISLFVLDQNNGTIGNEKAASGAIYTNKSLRNLKAISAYNGSIKSLNYDVTGLSFGGKFFPKENESSKNPKLLHSGMIVDKLYDGGGGAFYLNENYTNKNKGSYITNWLKD